MMFAITLTIVLWNIYSFLCPFWSLSAQLTLIIYGGKKQFRHFAKHPIVWSTKARQVWNNTRRRK